MHQTSHEGPQLKALEEEAQLKALEEEAQFKILKEKSNQGQKWQWNNRQPSKANHPSVRPSVNFHENANHEKASFHEYASAYLVLCDIWLRLSRGTAMLHR